MQVLEQWCTQNTFPRLRYIQERFGKVEILNNEDLEPFYRRNDQTSRWGFDRSSWGSTGLLAISI